MAKKATLEISRFKPRKLTLVTCSARAARLNRFKSSPRDTGRSKGFGFVQMADDAAAEKAIAQLNGKEVSGRNLTVNEARPMHKRDFGSRGGGGGGRRY